MTIQNVVFPDEVCDIRELYFRTDGFLDSGSCLIKLEAGKVLSTDTYMNVLDIGHWKKYTRVKELTLKIQAEGRFKICFAVIHGKEKFVCSENVCDVQKNEELSYILPEKLQDGLFFFTIEALGETCFYNAKYISSVQAQRDIRLVVDICTFHRNEQLERNLRRFSDSLFFDRASELYGRLKVYAVDNGDDFRSSIRSEWIEIYKNSNLGGGTGGFTRGLEEIKKQYGSFPCTHTVFMDDDVEFQMESFYRLYSFFALIRPEYADRGLAGRMFRIDRRNIQYTAVEKWNMGNIHHAGGNTDMCRPGYAIEKLNPTGEYGGWWMCAYPAEISLKNIPFPFFIHCDDVEYGLRQGNEVLTLNGVQVWHETYEYRMSPKILYYDIRNPFVVNVMEGIYRDADHLLKVWKQKMDGYHNAGKQKEKFLCVLALWHFGAGRIFHRRKGQVPEFYMWLSRQEKLLKIITPVFHRIAEKYVRHNFAEIVEKYKKNREERLWQ